MTREQAINVLENEKTCVLRDSCERSECASCDLVMPIERILSAYDMAIAALREQEERRWIPVTERLPEPWKNVFTNRTGGHLSIEFKCAGNGWSFDNDIVEEVTHWKPLPEPPKEDAR